MGEINKSNADDKGRGGINFRLVTGWTLFWKRNDSIKGFQVVAIRRKSWPLPVVFTGDDRPIGIFVDTDVLRTQNSCGKSNI